MKEQCYWWGGGVLPSIREAGLHGKAFQAQGGAPKASGLSVSLCVTPRPRLVISNRSPPSPSLVLWDPANHGRGANQPDNSAVGSRGWGRRKKRKKDGEMEDNDRERRREGTLGEKRERREQKEKDRQILRDRAPYMPGGAGGGGRDLEESQGRGREAVWERRTGDRETWVRWGCSGGEKTESRSRERTECRDRGKRRDPEMRGTQKLGEAEKRDSAGWGSKEGAWGRLKLLGSAQPTTPLPPSFCIT